MNNRLPSAPRNFDPKVAQFLRFLPECYRTVKICNHLAKRLPLYRLVLAETPSMIPFVLARVIGFDWLRYAISPNDSAVVGELKAHLKTHHNWSNSTWRWLFSTDTETAHRLLMLGRDYPEMARICAECGLPPNGVLTRTVLAHNFSDAGDTVRGSLVYALNACRTALGRGDREARQRIAYLELPRLLALLCENGDEAHGVMAPHIARGFGWPRLIDSLRDVELINRAHAPSGDYAWANPLPRFWDGDWCFMALASSRALLGESRAMSHCVASYDRRCRDGEARIYSARDRHGQRLATVSLVPTSAGTWRVDQISGIANGPAPDNLRKASAHLAAKHSVAEPLPIDRALLANDYTEEESIEEERTEEESFEADTGSAEVHEEYDVIPVRHVPDWTPDWEIDEYCRHIGHSDDFAAHAMQEGLVAGYDF